MGERTSYAPGTFCWADLGADDPALALGFYSNVFGWEPVAVAGAGGYTLMRLDGADVCGVYERHADSPGLPAWTSWVAVGDADAVVARALELGARTVRDTLDVPGMGRSGVIIDPQGAVLGLWEAGGFIGADLVNEPGAMVLNQLNTRDPVAAAEFLAALFGWQVALAAEDPAPYWGIANKGRLNGGMMTLEPPAGAHWLVYFTSEDLDGSDALIVEGGGAVVVPPMDVPGGRILVARDPGYAFFALFEGTVDP
jgi:predicted enzyme related to lactoylglutathione lyase